MTSTAEAHVDLGSYDEATALSGELIPRLEEAGVVWDLIWARSGLARVLVRRGEHAQAAPHAEWAAERVRGMDEPQLVALAMPAAAVVRLGVGDAGGAAALLSELDATANVRGEPNYVRTLADSVRTALGAGDPDLAARLAEDVEPKYPLHEHALTTARALLVEDRGEQAEAAELFAEAAEGWERFEMPWEQAQTLLGQGRCLLALGRTAEASASLHHARESFASLGARPALAETDALLARSSARIS